MLVICGLRLFKSLKSIFPRPNHRTYTRNSTTRITHYWERRDYAIEIRRIVNSVVITLNSAAAATTH